MGTLEDEWEPEPSPPTTWVEAGFEPADALFWELARFTPGDAHAWRRHGFGIDEAQVWRDIICEIELRRDPALIAAAMRRRGWTPEQMRCEWGQKS